MPNPSPLNHDEISIMKEKIAQYEFTYNTNQELNLFTLNWEEPNQRPNDKPFPCALNCAHGAEWVEWCQEHKSEWIQDKVYSVYIDLTNVYLVDTKEKLETLRIEYGYEKYYIPHIAWHDMSTKGYHGFHITSVFREFKTQRDYLWLDGYDIPQIFIWNADSIKGTKLVYDVSMDVSDSNCNMMPVRALEPMKHQKPPWHGYGM